MIVKASLRTDVELDEHAQAKVFFAFLAKHTDWQPFYYIDQEGRVKEELAFQTRPFWTSEDCIRKATELDYAVEKVVAQIKSIKN